MTELKILELKIPPVAIFLLFAGLMWLLSRLTPGYLHTGWWSPGLAVLLLLLGGGIGIASIRTFRQASTTVNPLKPDTASSLVDKGIYHWSRNPMYLALLLILASWGVFLANYYSLALLVVFIVFINRFQIAPEEVALERLFGEKFVAYKKRVRRWI